MTPQRHRQTQSDDPTRVAQSPLTTPTNKTAPLATASLNPPGRAETGGQWWVRVRRTSGRGQQGVDTDGASRAVQREGPDTRRSARASECRRRQRADTQFRQRNPHPHDAADAHAERCPLDGNGRGRSTDADLRPSQPSRDCGLAAEVAKIVESAPPLTDTQRHRLAAIFHPM